MVSFIFYYFSFDFAHDLILVNVMINLNEVGFRSDENGFRKYDRIILRKGSLLSLGDVDH